MNRNKHSYVMLGLLAVGATLFFTGFTGGGLLFLLWPLACIAMMFLMMRGMGSMGQNDTARHGDSGDTRGPVDAAPRR